MKGKEELKKSWAYLLGIFLLFFSTLASISKVIDIHNSIKLSLEVISILLFLVNIINGRYSGKELILITIIASISIYEYMTLKTFIFLFDFLAILALKNIEFSKVVKIDISVKGFYLLLHIILYLYSCMFNSSGVWKFMYYSSLVGYRNSLAFTHPNAAGSLALFLAIDIIYISKNKIKGSVIATILIIIVMDMTKSRTSIAIYIAFLVLYLLISCDKLKIITNFLYKYSMVIITVVNLVIAVSTNVMNNATIYALNDLLSGRIMYSLIAIKRYGINFLPNLINDSILDKTLWVDNFYMRTFIEYGWIILIVLNVLYYYVTRQKNVENIDKAIIIVFPYILISELFPINVGRSIWILIIGKILMDTNTEVKKEKIRKKLCMNN